MRRVRGPFNLSINQEMGVLVDGFDTPPFFMMGHARPYYAMRIEGAGYHKATDALAYMITQDYGSEAMRRLIAATAHRAKVRPLDLKALRRRAIAPARHIQRCLGRKLGVRAVHGRRISDLGRVFGFWSIRT